MIRLSLHPALGFVLPLLLLTTCIPKANHADAKQLPTTRQGLEVSIDTVAPEVTARLDDYLAAGQIDLAIEVIESLISGEQASWVPVDHAESSSDGFRRYISAAEYAHWKIANASQPFISQYRERVDSLAARAMEASDSWQVEGHEQVVERWLMSSYGAAAMQQLVDRDIERGHLQTARERVERLSAGLRVDASLNVAGTQSLYPTAPIWRAWSQLADSSERSQLIQQWLSGPAEQLPAATSKTHSDVPSLLAQLIWISILQADFPRAEVELEMLQTLFPDATGTFNGQQGLWCELMQDALDRSREQRRETIGARESVRSWATLAGDEKRAGIAAQQLDPAGAPSWSIRWRPVDASQDILFRSRSRANESPDFALSYFPIVFGDVVLWSEQDRIRAVNLSTGSPLWEEFEPSSPELVGTVWELHRSDSDDLRERERVGLPRHTSFTCDQLVFAKLGSPITGTHDDRYEQKASLVGLDFTREGRLLEGFPIRQTVSGIEFDGCPISDGESLFVLQRRTSLETARVEFSVVCYELGRINRGGVTEPKWIQKIADCDTHSFAIWDEQTHNLLTLHEQTLLINTNAGVVAAIDAEDGRPLWLSEYPRTAISDSRRDCYYQRDLNPCLVDRDMVLVLPTDSPELMAFNRSSGELIWRVELAESSYIVGVNERYLIAAGNGLSWVDRETGIKLAQFPRPGPSDHHSTQSLSPRGYGRAAMSRGQVYWPTRDQLFVFATELRVEQGADSRIWYTPQARQRINLRARGVTGGNLIVTDDYLLVAGSHQLWAFANDGSSADRDSREEVIR